MPLSGEVIVVGYLLTVALVVGVFLYLRSRREKEELQTHEPQQQQNHAAERPAVRRAAGGLDRMRRRRAAAQEEQVVDAKEDDDSDGEEEEIDDDGDDDNMGVDPDREEYQGKKGKKRLEKDLRKQAREQQRREIEASQTAKSKKEEKRLEERRKREEQREAQERQAAEEEAKRLEEVRKKEEAEFNEWKDLITVEGGGSAEEETSANTEALLTSFVDYIKTHKVVVLDDLAAEFKLKVQDVVNRVNDLEANGSISGIMDDRGKYIYIEPQEFQAVAAFINKRGRVSVGDLVSAANRLIDLTDKSAKPSVQLDDDIDQPIQAQINL